MEIARSVDTIDVLRAHFGRFLDDIRDAHEFPELVNVTEMIIVDLGDAISQVGNGVMVDWLYRILWLGRVRGILNQRLPEPRHPLHPALGGPIATSLNILRAQAHLVSSTVLAEEVAKYFEGLSDTIAAMTRYVAYVYAHVDDYDVRPAGGTTTSREDALASLLANTVDFTIDPANLLHHTPERPVPPKRTPVLITIAAAISAVFVAAGLKPRDVEMTVWLQTVVTAVLLLAISMFV